MSGELKPYTVIRDWDSGNQVTGGPVIFHVMAHSKDHAHMLAENQAYEQFGDDAEYLYGVTVLSGHAHEAKD